jgi:hypothetical protein
LLGGHKLPHLFDIKRESVDARASVLTATEEVAGVAIGRLIAEGPAQLCGRVGRRIRICPCEKSIKDTRTMPSITNTIHINARRDDVWAALADMPATRHWLPGVTAVRMDGDLRISDISPDRRSYRFEHVRSRCLSGTQPDRDAADLLTLAGWLRPKGASRAILTLHCRPTPG